MQHGRKLLLRAIEGILLDEPEVERLIIGPIDDAW